VSISSSLNSAPTITSLRRRTLTELQEDTKAAKEKSPRREVRGREVGRKAVLEMIISAGNEMEGCEVRQGEEQSDELATPSQPTKTARAYTSVQDTPTP